MDDEYPLAPPWIDEMLKESPIVEASNNLLHVDKVPEWLQSGDLIEKRGKRMFAVSIAQTEPRWRQLWRRLKTHFNER